MLARCDQRFSSAWLWIPSPRTASASRNDGQRPKLTYPRLFCACCRRSNIAAISSQPGSFRPLLGLPFVAAGPLAGDHGLASGRHRFRGGCRRCRHWRRRHRLCLGRRRRRGHRRFFLGCRRCRGAPSAPHCALRKSFHFMPLRVPASFAALYLALHSCIVSACADVTSNAAAPSSMATQMVT